MAEVLYNMELSSDLDVERTIVRLWTSDVAPAVRSGNGERLVYLTGPSYGRNLSTTKPISRVKSAVLSLCARNKSILFHSIDASAEWLDDLVATVADASVMLGCEAQLLTWALQNDDKIDVDDDTEQTFGFQLDGLKRLLASASVLVGRHQPRPLDWHVGHQDGDRAKLLYRLAVRICSEREFRRLGDMMGVVEENRRVDAFKKAGMPSSTGDCEGVLAEGALDALLPAGYH